MKYGFTPTVHHSNREIVRVNDTTYIGFPKTGRRVVGVGREIAKTPRVKAFSRLCG